MSAGPAYVHSPTRFFLSSQQLFYRLNYTWINHDRKSINLAAPTYIDYVMTWVQNLLDDENVFPTKSGASFASQISKRL